MIYVWLLSYLASFMLGALTLGTVTILLINHQDKKVDRVEDELVKYGNEQPRIVPKRSSLL